MAAPAGWYPDPQGPGSVRYWDGTGWTQHVQPVPAAPQPQPAPVGAGGWVPQPPTTSPQPGTAYPQPDASYGQAGGWSFGGPHTGVPRPHTPDLAEQLGQVLGQVRQYAGTDEGRATGTAAVGGALVADGVIGIGRNRQGIGGALSGMVFGALFVLISMVVIRPIALEPGSTHPGEASIQGTVVDQHSHVGDDGRMCSPEAQFVVGGQVYSAGSNGSSSTCPAVGTHVKVIYNLANPADARIAPEKMLQMIFWVFAGAGGLVFVLSLWTFIVRAGEISVGGFLLFKGLRARRAARG
ncbi:DUF2510 domain-containing protein [Cellulomonas alba]|uniref:DUF2510 domain-containing protein n=1 Tax=Cellulomonas alba TaxID=3053467 RepID=A0ABT7SG64_9CELL|nr:DUF2510 domain-containing protein [Cellulomonas alba]MDM7855170.1 DUF2510 domain-containing protein [Cellulomonas alba]